MSVPTFHVDHNEILVRPSKIDGCLQKVVPVSLRERILHAVSYLPIVGHQGERRMSDTMGNEILLAAHAE